MFSLVQAATWVALLLVVALFAAVFTKVLSGGISTRHLLYGRRSDGLMYLSPERIQLLLFTVWTALSYLLGAYGQRESGKLPDVSQATLALLGGSHALYLGGKAFAMMFAKQSKGDE